MIINGKQDVQVPAHLNFGKYMLQQLRAAEPNNMCLENYSTGERMTYMKFIKHAVRLSVGLIELGVKNGDVVGMGSEKGINILPTTFAVMFTGAAFTPFYLDFGRAALNHKLNMSRPSYFICSRLFWEAYSDIIKSCAFIKTIISFEKVEGIKLSMKDLTPSHVEVEGFEPVVVQGQTDTAVILYSSGTTGIPKAIELTHLHCISLINTNRLHSESQKTVLYGVWHHNYQNLFNGEKIVYVDIQKPNIILKCIQDCKIQVAHVYPPFVNYLAKTEEVHKYDLSSLKVMQSCAAPLHSKISDTVKRRLPMLEMLMQGYGMTETGLLASDDWAKRGLKPGSVGMVAPGVTLKIVDSKTREILGANQRGEICIRSLFFMKGYIGVDASTYLDEQGYFLTGDVGYYDEDQYLYVMSRLKDMIYYDGHEVCPLELETILLLHPGVIEVAVVGKRAGVMGMEPTAFVVRHPGAALTEHQLIDYIAKRVPLYMQLRGGVKFVAELPIHTGKIFRRHLREMLDEIQ